MSKHFKYVLLVTLYVLSMSMAYQLSKPEFSYKTYGNIANYFETEEKMIRFFDFKKGEHVAEIGAGKGNNVIGLSYISDSVQFYVQDIDSKILSETNFRKEVKKSEKYKAINTNSFKIAIGTAKESNLPNAFFDKIVLCSTFHEFEFMDEMLNDIQLKLKQDGKLYLLESFCFNKKHKNYSAKACIQLLNKSGFEVLQVEEKNLNGSTGMYILSCKKK